VQQPARTGTVVQPSRPGGVVVQPRPGATLQPAPQANVEAPAGRTVTRPTPTLPRPGGVVRGEARVETNADPGARQAPAQGTPGERIVCSIDTPRAPQGGLVAVTGVGFSGESRVRIAGRLVRTVESGPGRIVFRVPDSMGGGRVTVGDGERTGSCGILSVSSR
jgi:hypothetical protein